MMKKYLMKGMAIAVMAVTAASCSHDFPTGNSYNTAQYEENFTNDLLGGKDIDASQTWNTSVEATVNVSVNLDYGKEYTIYLFETDPLFDENAAYIGVGTVKSGSTEAITFAKPRSVALLYAALYDANNHATVKPLVLTNAVGSVQFGTASTRAEGIHHIASTGYRWSVTTVDKPDLSAYKTGTTDIIDGDWPNGNNNDRPENPVQKYHIPAGTTWTAKIPRLQSSTSCSVYVEGTMVVKANQNVQGGSAIVVGPTGKIVIEGGKALKTNDTGKGDPGMIYVEKGGIIEGDGTLEFANGTREYSYNEGTINVGLINVNGGALYNIGTIGEAPTSTTSSKTILHGPAGTVAAPSLFINHGQAYFASIGSGTSDEDVEKNVAGLSIENACNLYVTGKMVISKTSKMDNGSYTECGSLQLRGANVGDDTPVLYMGQAAYLKNKGDLKYLYFGIWGPTGENVNDAVFETTKDVSQCEFYGGNYRTYILDHVELILPSTFKAEISGGTDNDGFGWNFNPQGHLLWGAYNGYNFRYVHDNAYQWPAPDYVATPNKNSEYWTKSASDDRATCWTGTSPRYTVEKGEDDCGVGFTSTSNKTPEPNWIYYAYEDLGSTEDFDFNDVIIRVSSPIKQEDGNYKSRVELCCVGGTLKSVVKYGGTQIGNEVHAEFDIDAETYGIVPEGGNCSGMVNKNFPLLAEIPVSQNENVSALPITITVDDGTNRTTITTPGVGDTPMMIRVNGNSDGTWFWPKERKNISVAYPEFGEWGANYNSETYKNWYLGTKATEGAVVTWEK